MCEHKGAMDIMYTELSHLQKRLASALNMIDTDNRALISLRSVDRLDEGARASLVEATPTAVWQVSPREDGEKWRLSTQVPPLFQSTLSRLWYVNDCVRFTTSADDPAEKAGPESLPCDMWFWQPTSRASCKFSLAKFELDDFFKKQASLSPSQRVMCNDETGTKGTCSLFILPRNVKILMRDSMEVLREEAPNVYVLCKEYARSLAQIYGVTMETLVNETQLVITRASTDTGIPLQLARKDMYNRGPLTHAVIGLSQSMHDMAPSLVKGKDRKISRFTVKEGTMIVLDGEASARYAHGMPGKGQAGTGQQAVVYYMLTFDMDYTNPVVTGFVPELRAPVLVTPILDDQIVSGRKLPDLSGFPPYKRTPAQITIKSMFSRVQALESFLMMREGRPAPEETDHFSSSSSLCVGENISSIIMAE